MELLDLGKSRSAVGGKLLGLERGKGLFRTSQNSRRISKR